MINDLSADALAEVSEDMRTGHHPKPIDPELLARVDRVVFVGEDAEVEPTEGMRGSIERWVTDEPSQRGIEGIERMRQVRDDIGARCAALRDEMLDARSPRR